MQPAHDPNRAAPTPLQSNHRTDNRTRRLVVPLLTLLVLAVHGYHPYAEDGGLYVAGIKYLLNPSLYPAWSDFVTEHLRFSLFAPFVAAIARATGLPLDWILLALYCASVWATLTAGWALVSRCSRTVEARCGAVALLACWLTLPIAGTSLLLTDPYLTARSLSTPLALFALAFALDLTGTKTIGLEPASHPRIAPGCPLSVLPQPGGGRDSWRELPSLRTSAPPHQPRRTHQALLCALCLAVAAALHPLMAGYALASILVLLCAAQPSSRRRSIALAALATLALLLAALLQFNAPPESPAYFEVAMSRYYWFPFRWHWYEQLGLIAPLAVLAAVARRHPPASTGRTLARTAIALGAISALVALCFAHAPYATHLIARLQPLRCFQSVYAIMILLLGAWLGECLLRRRPLRWTILFAALAALMFLGDHQTFTASNHLELPGRTPRNLWVQAFLWARHNTPGQAVFALNPHYITSEGEDAQTFRAFAERSALPDYSKDGGEAAITPTLTPSWTAGQTAQANLDTETDAQRLAALHPLGATWLILRQSAPTAFDCPYRNPAVKVCRLP